MTWCQEAGCRLTHSSTSLSQGAVVLSIVRRKALEVESTEVHVLPLWKLDGTLVASRDERLVAM